MDKTKKKRIRRIIGLVAVALVVILLAVMPLLASQKKEADGPKASILTDTVTQGSLETYVVGGGTLEQEAAVEITVPSAVKLKNFLVANGDMLKKGDPVATVDRVTVMNAIAQVQETMDYLAEEIKDAGEEETGDKVKAQAGGTVKAVYGKAGESVQEVMLRDGALAVISLDGRMKVEFTLETAEVTLEVGDTVSVVFESGSKQKGTVEANLVGNVVVLLEDDGYTEGQSVTVKDSAGNVLGAGQLAINSPWKATAYTGTIDSVKIAKGESVDSGDTLFTLKDTGNTATYQVLLGQRAAYEDLMLELFTMYETELLTAPCDGAISGIDEESLQLLRVGDQPYTLTLLANAPNGDDEALYTNFVGKVLAVGTNGWSVQIDPNGRQIADYKELSGVALDTSTMTQLVLHTETQVPVYELEGGAWVQAEAATVREGDMLLFAADGENKFVWIVRLQKGQPQQPAGPSQPVDPSQPTDPSTPTDPTTPTRPGGNTGSFPNMGGSAGGFPNMNQQQEEEFELYGMETVLVASMIPQETMVLEITVDELDINQLHVGQEADVAVDALNGQIVTGIITDIGNTGSNNGGSSKFTVELTMDRVEGMLSGMNATAKLLIHKTEEVPVIPAAALALVGNKTVVYTGYDEKNEVLTGPVEVTLGRSDGEQVEILAGLKLGDTVKYAYYDTMEISYTPTFSGGSGFNFGR